MARPVNVRWLARPELSVVQAAYVVASGTPCVDAKTEQMLIEPVTAINTRLISSSVDVSTFWQRYRTEISADENHQRACNAALITAGCSELQVEQTGKAISSLLSECRMSFQSRFPKLTEQLQLRLKPLQDRWDTAGPGLLRAVQIQTSCKAFPSRVEGLLVQPMRGGDGGTESEKRFWIEAVLTDIDPMLPEYLRVAWLIAKAHLTKQFCSDEDADEDLREAWSLAAAMLVLEAASQLQLLMRDELPVGPAVQHWRLGSSPLAERLDTWWKAMKESGSEINVAVEQLRQQIKPAPEADVDFDTDI